LNFPCLTYFVNVLYFSSQRQSYVWQRLKQEQNLTHISKEVSSNKIFNWNLLFLLKQLILLLFRGHCTIFVSGFFFYVLLCSCFTVVPKTFLWQEWPWMTLAWFLPD